MTKKPCSMCRQVKPISEFRTWKTGGETKYDTYCKECRRLYSREYKKSYYETHKDEIKKRSHDYYHSHKKTIIGGVDGNPMEVPL